MGYMSMARTPIRLTTRRVATLVALLTALASCGQLPLGLLGGGGPNVAANTQIGKENRQSLVSTETGPKAGRDIVQKELEAETVDTVTINNEKIPVWVIIALVLGWLAPSPSEIGRGIYALLTRRKP